MAFSQQSAFHVGDHVTVNPGVTDVMSTAIVLDGWTGVVARVDEDMVQVAWDEKTMASMPAKYRRHWEADALPADSLWLPRNELTPFRP
jgi:hypothetical protein